jgi:hypothetical protein
MNDVHFVLTWNESTGEIVAYENGGERAFLFIDDQMSQLNDVNVWLGRSNWTADQNMEGEFDEVRFYNHVLTPNEVLGNFQAGPNEINSQLELAGELFVDIDVTDDAPGSATMVPNEGTLGGVFDARGGGVTIPRIELVGGTLGIAFDGNDFMQLAESAGGALVPTPPGLVGPDPTRTVEVWALNPAIAAEETMVSFGRRGGPNGSNMSFNYGANATFGAAGQWGPPDIGWGAGGAPVANRWHHLVITYDGAAFTTSVYIDGVLANSELLSAGTINTHTNFINLATQLEGNGTTPTPGLRGRLALARVRIHDGVLTPGRFRQSAAAGA